MGHEKKFTICCHNGDIERGGLFARNLLKPICFFSSGNGSGNIPNEGKKMILILIRNHDV